MGMLNRLDRFRREDFQNFCSILLSAEFQDFQAVEGAGGDFGNDGFLRAGDTLFQAYAPDRVSWCLIAESWGERKLLQILTRHPEVRAEFPELLLPDLSAQLQKFTSPPRRRSSEIAEEVHAGFAEMVEQVQRWRSAPPDKFGVLDLPDPNSTWARWRALHHKARLHLPPESDELIDNLYLQISQMRASHANWRMFLNSGDAQAYATEIKRSFHEARNTHPTLFMETWGKLEEILKKEISK